MEKLTIRNQHCPNAQCAFYDQRENNRVVIHSQKDNRLQCKECKKTWVAHREEEHFGIRSNVQVFIRAKDLMRAGISAHRVSKLVEISPSTAVRWAKKYII